ncbi:MAG TPA: dihydrodipicolinate synthase family protein [Candidatus Binataceae bacterium]|nr:dihydrodipicolinate synthase family protein [Candidatus Binataceae bacterium]
MDFDRKNAKKWANRQIRDLYMCPLTPIGKDLAFDESGIRENIDKYVEIGLNGLVVGGFISECWNVKLSDWMRFHELVAEANRGRMDLWTIILDPSVHQALEKMAFVEKLGFSGAEVINPVVQLRTDDEIFDYFKYMTDRSGLAVCLYRTPVSGKVLGFELMERLSNIDTVIGVKQGNLNRAETLKLRRALRPDFIVSDPSEYFYLDDLRHGGQVIWGELSYILYGKKRHLMRAYMDLARAGKWEEAYQKWAELTPARQLFEDIFIWEIVRTATYAGAIGSLKIWYEAIGLKAGQMLPPVRNFPRDKAEALVAKLHEIGVC